MKNLKQSQQFWGYKANVLTFENKNINMELFIFKSGNVKV